MNQPKMTQGDVLQQPHQLPVPESSPFNVRVLARLCGLETEPLATARVLELGCGVGRNLQAFALACPQAEVIGVDIWPDELAQGRHEAEEQGIHNLHLLPLLYTDIGVDFGQFHYIIVRDEYTWAPNVIREAILRICAENLAPNGVVYLGAQVNPGWRAGDTLRDAIQLHAHSATSIEDIRACAGAVLQLMAHGATSGQDSTSDIQLAAKRLLCHPDYYISADFLESASVAPYLLDVVTAAQQRGLAYLCDALLATEQASTYGNAVHLQHSLVSMGKVWPVKQQYLDFAVNRKFRQSLFTFQSNVAQASAGVDLDNLRLLNYACALKRRRSPNLPAPAKVDFISPGSKRVAFDDGWVVALCDALGGVWPHTLPFSELVRATNHVEPGLDSASHESAVRKALEHLLFQGWLRCSYGPGPYDIAESGRIQFIAGLERSLVIDSDESKNVFFNLWNEFLHIKIDRSPALIVELFEQVERGENTLLAKHPELVKFIEYLKWHGLLMGSDQAWVKYYSAVIALEADGSVKNKLHYLPSYVGHFIKTTATDERLRLARPADRVVQPPVQLMREMHNLRAQRSFDKLEAVTRSFIERFPQHDYGWHVLALMQRDMGQTAESAKTLLKAISLRPNDPHLFTGLVLSLDPVRGSTFSFGLFGLSLWLQKNYAPAYTNLGVFYRDCDKRNIALKCFEQTLLLEPGELSALKNKGVILGELGDLEQAIQLLEKVIKKNPADFSAHSNCLYVMSLYERIDPKAMFEAHVRFGHEVDRYVRKTKLKFTYLNKRDPDKQLKIGFVSGDLRNHAVSRFIEPIWRVLDRSAFQIFVYNNHAEIDHTTKELQALADKWEQIELLSHEQVARKIHSDEVDILLDLSGHTGYNRLPAFGFKPAPIQATWIGYPGTSGLKTMDYYFVNEHLAPEGFLDDQFTEKLIRMAATATFHPGHDGGAVNELPALSKGHFTFASFNRMNKTNPAVFEAWVRILDRVAGSRLIIGHVEFEQFDTIREFFRQHNIADDRLVFQPRVSVEKYMVLHHEVDMLLDSFPYNGGTTTCYGLWMGVPTLTLAGATVPARTGAAIMGAIGLPEFIATDVNDYVERAVELSADLSRLSEIRQSSRLKFSEENSVWRNETVAKSFERALRHAWHLWCQGKSAKNFTVKNVN